MLETEEGHAAFEASILNFTESDRQRFWSKVERKGSDECWPWAAQKNVQGYGIFKVRKITGGSMSRKAHRISFLLSGGKLPFRTFACHRCDNPSCVNPAHIFAGSHKDNVADMMHKKRVAVGERVGRAKRTSKEVIRIRELYASGMKQLDIADMYKTSAGAISHIVNRKKWKHIP